MERPSVTKHPIKREVTGEIVYLDSMRQRGKRSKQYPDELSDTAVEKYEMTADLMMQQGKQPEILSAYEHYDEEVSELALSCAALAEELLQLKAPGSRLTFEDIVVDHPAIEVLEKLRAIRAGELLAADTEQLAIASNGEYYPVLDIAKQAMTLQDVGVRVWGWSSAKYIFTNEPDEPYDYPADLLVYPADEQAHWYQLDISFRYRHPDAGTVAETVTLAIGQCGELCLYSQVWASAYAETGYEGHRSKQLKDTSEADIAAFADVLAEIVGDEPEANWRRQERLLREYIDQVPDALSRKYLVKWLENGDAYEVTYGLTATRLGDISLAKALRSAEMTDEARASLVALLDEARVRTE